MSDYRADLAAMQSLVEKAEGLEKRIDDRVEAIGKRIAELHVDWRGDAAKAHQAASAEWAAGAAEMKQALTDLRTALMRAQVAYHGVGQLNHRMWPTL